MQQWRKMNGMAIRQSIRDEIEQEIQCQKRRFPAIKVCLGTDSQVYGKSIRFATVVVIVRMGRGGLVYYSHDTVIQKMSIQQRMLIEVARTMEVAEKLKTVLDVAGIKMEIHADINSNPIYKSQLALSTAMGYVKGMGYEFRAKPYAFASSCCANKLVQ